MKKLLLSVLIAVGCVVIGGEIKESPALANAVQVEDAFAQVVDYAKPAVVVITNKQIPNRMMRSFDDMPDELRDFFGIPRERDRYGRRVIKKRRMKPEVAGKGSGIIIREDGYILTNYHVIKDADFLEVRLEDGTVYDNAKKKETVIVVGYDEESDLAVIRIPKKEKGGYVKLDFADSDALRVGQWAIAIGAPFNLDYSVTIGCVSQKGRTDMGMSAFDSYIQTDASINPGNSGGPLLDIKGRIIGVNQFIVTGGMSKGSIGLGFAICSNMAKTVSDELISNGSVERPFLGIGMADIKPIELEKLGLDYGVRVKEVYEGEAAAKAGVDEDDVIVEVNGHPVKSAHELLMEVTKYKPGDKIKLKVYREGKKKEITVKAGNRNEFLERENDEEEDD